MSGGECSNCSAAGEGATRRLVVEQERTLEVSLCETCFDGFVAQEWIEATG